RNDVRFYKFLQWQVDRQLAEVQDHAIARGMKIGLYHDLALATDRFGADLWMNRPFYTNGARVGRPRMSWLPAARIGDFRRPTARHTATTAMSCSRNPSARTPGTAARCASIT